MSKNSIRVQMYPDTKKYLEEIAKEHSCLKGDKPSIAELLVQIQLGRLIVSKFSVNPRNKPDNASIGLRIEVPRYLTGAIAIISDKIAKHQGNISTVKTKSHNNLGILQVFLSLPPESSLSELVADLQRIKIQQLAQFNEENELKLIANQFESELVGRKRVKTLDNFLEKSLISDMACVIGFKIIAIDEVGILAKIADQIAKARLLIYSVSENVGDDVGEAKIKLFLYLRLTTKISIAEQIKKIDYVVNDLEKIDQVKSVDSLGVDSLD